MKVISALILIESQHDNALNIQFGLNKKTEEHKSGKTHPASVIYIVNIGSVSFC